MPLYEYQCEACGKRFEVIRRVADAALDVCTLCGGGPVTRLLSSPAIQFKGTGWYITDYSQKGKAPADKPGAGDEKKESAKKESPASTTEPTASKTESTTPATKSAPDSSGPSSSGS